jgi:molecular chaperone GrpE
MAQDAQLVHARLMSQDAPSCAETAAPADSQPLETLRKEVAVQTDLHLRLAADFENFKRRSRQELEARAAAQKEAFIEELLPVIDNLERALASSEAKDANQFHQGVEITLKQLQQLLRLHGIETGDLTGRPFDPHRQEALSRSCDPKEPDQSILKMFRRGYWRGDKIIRVAQVEVNDLTLHKKPHHGR